MYLAGVRSKGKIFIAKRLALYGYAQVGKVCAMDIGTHTFALVGHTSWLHLEPGTCGALSLPGHCKGAHDSDNDIVQYKLSSCPSGRF